MRKTIEVCRPCVEAMRRAGKVLREVEHRRDEKGTTEGNSLGGFFLPPVRERGKGGL